MKMSDLRAMADKKQQSVLMMLSLERVRSGRKAPGSFSQKVGQRAWKLHANRATLRAAKYGHSEFPATGHIYSGTVDPAEVKRRRAKNKVARRTRAAARKQG